jgi:chemotaxis protein CheC
MPFSDLQLDALRELANIGSGTAASALSQMLDREVDLSVPRALVLEVTDAVDACGDPERTVAAVMIGVRGDLEGIVLLLIGEPESRRLCGLLGVDRAGLGPGSEEADSALREIGNILGTSYLNGLAAITGLGLQPTPPLLRVDMLGAIVSSLLVQSGAEAGQAFLLESELEVASEPCAISFLLVPTTGGIQDLLAPLHLSETAT